MGRDRHSHVSSWLIRLGGVVFLLVGLGLLGRSQARPAKPSSYRSVFRGRTWSRSRGSRSGRLPLRPMARCWQSSPAVRAGIRMRAGRARCGCTTWPCAAPRSRNRPDSCALAFAPDGRSLATGGSGHGVTLRDPRSGAVRATLGEQTSVVSAVAYAPDGQMLATRSLNRGLRLWDVASGESSVAFRGTTEPSRPSRLRLDSRTLASVAGDGDRAVKLWDVASGTLSARSRTHPARHGGGILAGRAPRGLGRR